MDPIRLRPNSLFNQAATVQTATSPAEAQKKFADFLNNSLKEVNDLQIKSDVATERLATGQINDLHEVMIAAQKASIGLQATVEIRNKAIEAYQEMMRMQI